MRRLKTALSLICVAMAGGASPALAAGMPQLDASTFATQIFWLVLSFVVLYILMSRVALPRIHDVLEERQMQIEGNLQKAESLKGEAQTAQDAYEDSLAKARAEAGEALRQAQEKMAGDAAERNAALSERLTRDVLAAEKRIAGAKEEAVAGIGDLVAEVAGAAVARLAGSQADDKVVRSTVKSVLKENP